MKEKLEEALQKYNVLHKNTTRLWAPTFDNLEEMNKFLEIYELPRLNHKLEKLNRHINRKESFETSQK